MNEDICEGRSFVLKTSEKGFLGKDGGAKAPGSHVTFLRN